MRWLLVALLLVGLVSALPPQPSIPSEALPEYALVLNDPGTLVNATSNFTYSHDAPTSLNCVLRAGSTSRSASVAGSRTERISLANGSHSVNVTCSNASLTLHSGTFSFTVNNESIPEPEVIILYPLNPSLAHLNVTYKHTFNTSASCQVFIDSKAVAAPVSVANNTWRTLSDITFQPRDYGQHAFTVNCTAAATKGATRLVNVSNDTAIYNGLEISPEEPFTQSIVTFEGEFLPFRIITISILGPAGLARYNTTTSDGDLEFEYTVTKAGQYLVNATQENKTLGGRFTARDRVPSIMIGGNRSRINQGTTFLIIGREFLASDTITITISGSGTSITNTTKADSSGDFSFAAPRTLAPRNYTISAKGKNDTKVASLTVEIVGVTNATPNNTWIPPSQPIPPSNPTPSNPTPGPTPPINNPLPEPEPYPEPYPEPNPDDPYVEKPSGLNTAWLWYVLVGVLVAGAGVGYLIYNGTIELSNLGDLFSGNSPPKGAKIDYADAQTIKSFIFSERAKGFDDLTIRSALLGKNWDKNEVDKVFDSIYK